MSDDFTSAYRRKIKTVDEIIALIGPRPRNSPVVMCHGTFDLVHPGHLRHLHYAKTKGGVLIVSLTSDAHIEKAHYRPFVPQDLRAINLAALEMVDYVLIDPNPTPLENLSRIQPDYFAKGYEYQDGGLHPKTQEEKDVIDAYGGEILFTPGDIIYSSSVIIETKPPNLAIEKLLLLMEAEGVRTMSASAPCAAESGSAAATALAWLAADAITTGSCSLSRTPGSCAMVASEGEFFTECVFSL